MKIEILKEYLEEGVALTSRISNKNLSLPVLGCVVIAVKDGNAVMRATNLDVSVEVALKAKVATDGLVAVPAHILSQTISTATDQKLTLEASDTTLTVSGTHGSARIKTVDSSDFPTLPFVKEGEGISVTLPGRELLRALKSVSFAASTSGMRPELSSVFLSIEEGILTAAATDSFRLAEVKLPIKTTTSTDPILIPQRNIADIVRMVSGAETVEVRRGDNQITVIVDGSYLTSRTLDGVFPEYQAIIPTDFPTKVTMLTEDALKALRKVAVFADTTNQVTLSVSKEGFVVDAKNTQVGETKEEVQSVVEGGEVTINFNARYILDSLSAITSDSVVLSIAGPGKPMVISDVPDRGFLYLVMPMNK